jgi:hypothetical protein
MIKFNLNYRDDDFKPNRNARKVGTNVERQSEYYNKPSIKDLMNDFKCFLVESGFNVNEVNMIEYIEDRDLLIGYLFNYYKNEIEHCGGDRGLYYARVQIDDRSIYKEIKFDETQSVEEVKNIATKQIEEKLLEYLLEKYKQSEEKFNGRN